MQKLNKIVAAAGTILVLHTLHAQAAMMSTTTAGLLEMKKTITAEKARLLELSKPSLKGGLTHTLRSGSRGEEVRRLQQFLVFYASSTAPEITGYFGKQTKKSVQVFQRNELLEQTGIVGQKTRARIFALSRHELVQDITHTATTSKEVAPEITSVIFSDDVGEDGSGTGSSVLFASSTKNIFAILALTNAKQNTEVGLVRTFNGAYVDSNVSHPSRTGLRYMHFQWSLKKGEQRTPGAYSVTFYINGRKSKTAAYTIN